MTVVKDTVTGKQDDEKSTTTTQPFKTDIGVRLQLESLHHYLPWFILAVTTVQAIAVCVELGLGGVAPISISEKLTMESKSMCCNMLLYIIPNELV